MSRVEFSEGLAVDFDRIAKHLRTHGVADIAARIAEIADACAVLANHPMIGRRVDGSTRELVIGKGARGYVALYEYLAEHDRVNVLAVRSQKEAGVAHESLGL